MSQLELFEKEEEQVYYAGEGFKHCLACDRTLPIASFGKLLTTGSGKQFYQARCKPCSSARFVVVYHIRKTAPPVPAACECCGKDFSDVVKKNIHMDHCAETETFRGWLCQQCNVGLGYLGDDLDGVTKAVAYLERHYNEQ
jgi:hypothetical protein